MSEALSRPGHVVLYTPTENSAGNGAASSTAPAGHEAITRIRIGEKLAELKGHRFAGEYDATANYAHDNLYFVPVDTLLLAQAKALGIHTRDQLFGGIVPHPFIATKSITHPLVHPHAVAPAGWMPSFPAAVANVVLAGFTAFSAEDAHTAASQLLQQNSVRVKPALGIGGSGQSVITTLDQLDNALDAIEPEELALYGVVLEQNLEEVATYSVGQVHVGSLRITYYGTQHLTTNHRGAQVYGGSVLHVVRGNFDALRQLKLAPPLRLAVEQAYQYDTAANVSFPGFIASRRNYDIAQGIDSRGQPRSGVLEQSWRLGGASPAEIAALQAFATDPELRTVQAASCERYGAHEPPPYATLYFRGEDPHVGQLVKYSTIDSYEYFTE